MYFSCIFVPLEEKTLVFITDVFAASGRTSSTTPLFRLFFGKCVENIAFAMFFLQGT